MNDTPKVEIQSRDIDHAIAIVGDVLVQLWLRSVTNEAAAIVDKAGDLLVSRGRPFTTLIVVGADAKPPQAQARQILTSFGHRHAPALRLAVQVVEASGLRGAIMRSIMTGMAMVAKSIPVVIVRSLDEGIAALAGHETGASSDALARVVADLRRRAVQVGAPPARPARPGVLD